MFKTATLSFLEDPTKHSSGVSVLTYRIGNGTEFSTSYSDTEELQAALDRLEKRLAANDYVLEHTDRRLLGGTVQQTRLYIEV